MTTMTPIRGLRGYPQQLHSLKGKTNIINNLYIQYYPKPVVYSLLFSDVIALRDPGLENKRSRPLAVKQPVLLARQS